MIKITFYIDDGRALPRVENNKPTDYEIALNRRGGGCWYNPCNFRQHDSHAPWFSNTQVMQDYINRVTKDILEAWKKQTTEKR